MIVHNNGTAFNIIDSTLFEAQNIYIYHVSYYAGLYEFRSNMIGKLSDSRTRGKNNYAEPKKK